VVGFTIVSRVVVPEKGKPVIREQQQHDETTTTMTMIMNKKNSFLQHVPSDLFQTDCERHRVMVGAKRRQQVFITNNVRNLLT
jgi:hypothetical protein